MRNIILHGALLGTVAANLQSRDYIGRTYYAIHVKDPLLLDLALQSLEAVLEHPFEKLADHYLISVPKTGGPLRKRSSAFVELLEEQTPRQRHKRFINATDPSSYSYTPHNQRQTEPDLTQELAEIQERFDIRDPIFPDQWHLFNARDRGHDINVTGVWDQGITGQDTVVALVDDGIDMNSRDLAANYYAAGSYDFNDHNSVPSPKLFDDFHGTRCAGEIAAVRNDVCGVGVAYEGKVSGLRILSGRITDADEALSLNYDFDNNLIYSCSWGPPDDGKSMEAPGVLIKRAIVNGIQHGRNGKGSIFVFASGNGAVFDDNCNFDGYTNSIFSITIGGIDRLDLHPYYSELCAPQLAVTYSSGSGDYIHTSDVGENSCSTSHGGTSAAAPIGAGIFALVLSVRPDLTWRDLQYLCVETAVPISLDDDDWRDTTAGHRFNHKFGYGKLDAWAMVEKAKVWQNVKAQSWYHSPVVIVNEELGTEPHQQITSYFDVTEADTNAANLERVEHVTVTVNIRHQHRGDVTVDLASPDGVVSNLATVRRYDASQEGFDNWTFMTVKHWGESGVGQWRLIVGDHDNPEETGVFQDWRMTLWGESRDESLAVPLPLPGDSSSAEPQDEVVDGPVAVSTVVPAARPTTSSRPAGDVLAPERPVASKVPVPDAHTPLPTTIIQPLPDSTEPVSTNFDWRSRKALWLYVATGAILSFILLIGGWVFVQRRRKQMTFKEDYEFKQLRSSSSGRTNTVSAGELYDAFAIDDESDEEEDGGEEGGGDSDDDGRGEVRPLRP